MTTTCYRVRAHGGGCSSPIFRRVHYLLSGHVLRTRNDDNDMLPGGTVAARGANNVVTCFFRRVTTRCPVVSCCTRNDGNDILPQPLGGGCSSFFPSRHYSAVRSRLRANGTMTTTSYRSRSAVGVRHLFSVKALLCCPVGLGARRNDVNDILPQPYGGGCSSPFPSRHYSAVRSCLGARGTMTTTSYRVRAAVGVRHPFSVESLLCCPVTHYSAVRSCLGARGTMTTTCYRVRVAVGVRHLFPSSHYSAVRSCLVARER
ncbi:uncharacterized protein TNCV_1204791 [Trichonephila clavipes]|nr:uncharacterized protein TNCV_1204791 [Trichonephila clavipes]